MAGGQQAETGSIENSNGKNEKIKTSKEANISICPKCDQFAASRQSNKEKGIRCKICTFWWHPTCGGLGREEYELFLRLAELGSSDLWQCATCKVSWGTWASDGNRQARLWP